MPRTVYNDSEAENTYQSNRADSKIPLPKERPSSADAEWNNSPEGRMQGEINALKNPGRSWLGRAIYGR